MATVIPLIVITGPTASGKTGLALRLAERYGGEIICADSRTVYRGMDIGTAKPTEEERRRVPHHLLDVATPGERFTVADFQRLAQQAIADVRARGKVPFLVGGTGLYIDAIVLEFELGRPVDEFQREALARRTIAELQALIERQELSMPENPLNKRQLTRVLERNGGAGIGRTAPDDQTFVVAIATEKTSLESRIRHRARQMFAQGVLDEARHLAEQYGWESEAMTGNIYPILRRVLDGEIGQEEAIELFVIRDRQLAKRQVTWLKRHPYVEWLSLPEADRFVCEVLERRTA